MVLAMTQVLKNITDTPDCVSVSLCSTVKRLGFEPGEVLTVLGRDITLDRVSHRPVQPLRFRSPTGYTPPRQEIPPQPSPYNCMKNGQPR